MKGKNVGDKTELFDAIWQDMRKSLTFIKFKTNIDRNWKECYLRVLYELKFH